MKINEPSFYIAAKIHEKSFHKAIEILQDGEKNGERLRKGRKAYKRKRL